MTRSVTGAPASSSAVATACMSWRLASQLRCTALAPTTAASTPNATAPPTNTRAADVASQPLRRAASQPTARTMPSSAST